MPSKLGGHFMSGGHPTPWASAGARLFKFTPDVLGTSAQIPAGPLVVGKLDQQDAALGLTDWKALRNQGVAPKAAADLRFSAQRSIYVGPGKPRVDRYLANPRVDVWEDDNEIVPDNPAEAQWYATYCIEMMRLYESIGRKRANFSFAVGTPDIRPGDSADVWPHLLPAVRYARDHGHYLALHEYMGFEADLGVGWKQIDGQHRPLRHWHGRKLASGQPDESYPYGWVTLRYRYVYDTYFRPAGLDDARLIITELGCDAVESVTPAGVSVGSWREHAPHWQAAGRDPEQVYADMLKWYDGRIQEDSFVVGATVFTVGSIGYWARWDIAATGVEEALLEHISAGGGGGPNPIEPPAPPPAVGENLLPNPSWEEGWADSEFWPMTTQDPKGWKVLWNVTSGDDYRNPFAPEQPYGVGEAIHKFRSQIPDDEEEDFFGSGDVTYKIFANHCFWVRMKTRLNLEAGRYALRTPVFTDTFRWIKKPDGGGYKDYKVEDDQTQMMVKVNGKIVRDWTPLPAGRLVDTETVIDHAGGEIEIVPHFRCNWAISNNLWPGDWSLRRVTVTEPEPPPPLPTPERPIKILDISKWQGTIDPARMKEAGVDGVMVRASYATGSGSFVDERVNEFAPALAAASIPFGFYHYFHPARPVDEQFAVFKSVADRYGYTLRLALDLEEITGLDSTTAAKASSFAARMRDEFPLPDGKRHLVYTSTGHWRGSLGSPSWGAEYDLWIAAWTTAERPIVPAPWATWVLWQHTSDGDGSAHGVGSARLDLNHFNGNSAALAAWLAPQATEPAPTQPSLAEVLWAAGIDSQTLSPNPTFAIERAMRADGFQPVGNERRVAAEGKSWAYQRGWRPGDGSYRTYACPAGDWRKVYYVSGPTAPLVESGRAPEPPVTPQPDAGQIDLLPYLRGDGRAYMVRHPDGNQEKLRTIEAPRGWRILKNSQWEELWLDGDHIWRGKDTSAGEGNYYRQFEDGSPGARWCPRRMQVGQTWTSPASHTVQTYRKSDCAPVAHPRNGRATNRITLAARHDSRTWNGITVRDVVELVTHTGEHMYFANGYGLVAWEAAWGRSAISAELPPSEADNQPESGCFSS